MGVFCKNKVSSLLILTSAKQIKIEIDSYEQFDSNVLITNLLGFLNQLIV